jgi:hypothetical protein
MADDGESKIYHALVLPEEALAKGGAEILRAGLVEDELFVGAARAFADPAVWGDVLADIARHIATMMSAEDGAASEQEILTVIGEAFVTDLGGTEVKDRMVVPRKAKSKKAAKRKTAKKTAVKKSAKKPAKKTAKRKKR